MYSMCMIVSVCCCSTDRGCVDAAVVRQYLDPCLVVRSSQEPEDVPLKRGHVPVGDHVQVGQAVEPAQGPAHNSPALSPAVCQHTLPWPAGFLIPFGPMTPPGLSPTSTHIA